MGVWETVETITVSDGDRTVPATVELRLDWPQAPPVARATSEED